MACRVQYGRHAMAHATTKISCNTPPFYAFLRASASTRLSTFNCPSTLRSFASYRLNKFSSSVVVLSNCYVFLFSFFEFLLICISMRNCDDAHNLDIKGSKFLKLTLPIISYSTFRILLARFGWSRRWSVALKYRQYQWKRNAKGPLKTSFKNNGKITRGLTKKYIVYR